VLLFAGELEAHQRLERALNAFVGNAFSLSGRARMPSPSWKPSLWETWPRLKDGTGTLSVFTNEKGGIIDDTVVTRVTPEHIYLVVNAGCLEKDLGMWAQPV